MSKISQNKHQLTLYRESPTNLSGRKRTVTVTFSLDSKALGGIECCKRGLIRADEEVGEL